MAPKRRISMVRWMIGIIILIPVLLIWSQFLTDRWQTFKVISRSMEPTLNVGDYLIMCRQTDFPSLDNCIVVLSDPDGGTFPVVKRVIAAANSTVRVSMGEIFVDGSKKPVPGEPVADSPNTEWKLGPDEVFIMGDNRNNSRDSTDFGPVPRDSIMGVITYRYWPFDSIGAIQ